MPSVIFRFPSTISALGKHRNAYDYDYLRHSYVYITKSEYALEQ